MRVKTKLFLVGATVLATASLGAVVAQASQQTAADDMPSLVEDYSYPGAAAIQASDGIVLVSGDGHILYAPCNTAPVNNVGVIHVRTTDSLGPNHDGQACFKVTGPTGHLVLKVPAVYEIRGDGQVAGAGHKGTANLTTDDGTKSTVTLNPSGSTPVGVGAKDGAAPTTLLALDYTG